MRKRFVQALMLSLMSFIALGCSTAWQSVDRPEVQVEQVQVTDRTDEGVRVEVTVRLSNPNEIALPLVYASYGVELDGLGRFELGDATNRSLPAKGSQIVVLPAAFAVSEPLPDAQPYRVWGHVQYEPPGQLRKVLTETGIPLPGSSFASEGRME